MTYIIAIDGPSGSGKSTISKRLADILSIEYLNTGSMYRAVTLYFLDNKLTETTDNETVVKTLDEIRLDFIDNNIYLNDKNVEGLIRTDEVTKNTSWVSANPLVRKKLVDMQREIAKEKSFILDGRDIGTVVFPDAKYKFYLTADPHQRAIRRSLQEESNLTLEELEQAIIDRDLYDSSRAVSPLKKANDAIEVDTSEKTIDETITEILAYMDNNDGI